MIVAFYIVAIGGLWFFLFRRRKFDFTSAAFIGSLVYFFPGFVGRVFNPYLVDQWPIDTIGWQAYAVWIIALVALIVSGISDNPQTPKQAPAIETSRSVDITLVSILIIALFMMLSSSGQQIYSADKDDVLAALDRNFIAFSTIAQIAFVTFAVQRKFLFLLIPGAAISFLVYIGFRAEAANSVIAWAVYVARREGVRKFASPIYALLISAAIMFLISYKFLYIAIKMGRFDLVSQSLQGDNFIVGSIMRAEPFTTQTILNEVLLRDYWVGPASLGRSMLALIPFSNNLLGIPSDALRFQFQEQLFPNLPYGMASNIYANFYASLGPAGVLLWVFAAVFLIRALDRLLFSIKGLGGVVLLLVAAYLAFYINRNDVAYSITSITRLIYMGLFASICSRIIGAIAPPEEKKSVSVSLSARRNFRSPR